MTPPARDARYASTLGKGLTVLRAFKPSDNALGNREISRRTGIPSATVSRLTYTLAQHGFLVQLQPSEAFKLGPAAIAVGHTAREGFSFFQAADPLMQELANQISNLVAVGVQDGDAVILARAWRPVDHQSIWLSEGHRLPMTTSAPGRALLAGQPPSDADSQETIQDRQTLQSRGFVVSVGGWNSQVNACAVPFSPDQQGMPFAFLCGALAEDLSEDMMIGTTGPALLNAVERLKLGLGLA